MLAEGAARTYPQDKCSTEASTSTRTLGIPEFVTLSATHKPKLPTSKKQQAKQALSYALNFLTLPVKQLRVGKQS